MNELVRYALRDHLIEPNEVSTEGEDVGSPRYCPRGDAVLDYDV